MRLLDTATGQFRGIDDPIATRYAILSHTWDSTGEQLYEEIVKLQAVAQGRADAARVARRPEHEVTACLSILDDPALSPKIRRTCQLAITHGYELVWIDSCCINKDSSAELSEAINSMFDWYRLAHICYVHLRDVSCDSARPFSLDRRYNLGFRESKWHTRGWTLQELIASKVVLFLNQDWTPFGTKISLATALAAITGINRDVLTGAVSLDSYSVAQRMCWAAHRQTTRPEDRAYSLMGLFGVHMPTIDGEGDSAFLRLQEEIMKRIPDQTLFAWGPRQSEVSSDDARLHDAEETQWGLLAGSPREFQHCSHLIPLVVSRFTAYLPSEISEIDQSDPILGASGIRMHVPVFDLKYPPGSICGIKVALIRCWDTENGRLLMLPLYRPAGRAQLLSVFVVGITDSLRRPRVLAYTPTSLRLALKGAKMDTLSVLSFRSTLSDRSRRDAWELSVKAIVLSPWCIPLLDMEGFSIEGQARLDTSALLENRSDANSFTFLHNGTSGTRSKLIITVVPVEEQIRLRGSPRGDRTRNSIRFSVSYEPVPCSARTMPHSAWACNLRSTRVHDLLAMYTSGVHSWAEFELREGSVPATERGLILRVTLEIPRTCMQSSAGSGSGPVRGALEVVGNLTLELISRTSYTTSAARC
ncbi:hypothetical protein BN946_scf185027.g7 [Trametes cinnabarina]|uniref:Uncharacterized protein n=1 Tax=Pycnoporus cinnabarinus TaxID=5643 RepID=A0A060SV95_PYCCI|nr:hypothetical protein BN946_scf185027.g7 [Trametes cinnabarina]